MATSRVVVLRLAGKSLKTKDDVPPSFGCLGNGWQRIGINGEKGNRHCASEEFFSSSVGQVEALSFVIRAIAGLTGGAGVGAAIPSHPTKLAASNTVQPFLGFVNL